MLFKILGKEEFRSLVEIILESNEVIAPKKIGTRADGEPIHQFLPIGSFEEMDLDYRTTEYSAKTYFLPYRENLCTFNFDGRGLGAGDRVPDPTAGDHRAACPRHQRPAEAGQGVHPRPVPVALLRLAAQEHLHRRNRSRSRWRTSSASRWGRTSSPTGSISS